jgi:hypothetical protein
MKFIILIGCCFVLSSCASLQSNKSPYDNQPWANHPSPNDSPMMDSPDGSRAWPLASGPNTVDSVSRFPSSWFKWQK